TPSVTNSTTTENTQTNSGLSITRHAVDSAEVNYFYITGITNGTLFLNDGTTQVFNGQFLTNAQVGAKLRFTPTPGMTSAGGNLFSFTVQASTLNDGTLLSTPVTAYITVNSVNDPPQHTLPAAQSVAEDVALVFSTGNGNAITMNDDASETGSSVKTTLSVTKGKLTVAALAGGTITGNNSATLVLTGPVAWINSLLEGMSYQPNSNVFGADTLQIVSNDQGNSGAGGVKSTTDSLGITIVPMADTPAVTAATSNEDTQTSSGLLISRNAVDGAEVGYFKITGLNTIPGTLYQNNGTTIINEGDFITFAQANAGLRFTPAANVHGLFSFTITAATLANNIGLGASTTANLTINAVNDAPVNTVPAAQSLAEDGSLTFNNANSNLLSVSDLADTAQSGATDQLSVTVAVLHGIVNVTTGSGATVGGNSSATVTLSGTAAQINAALDQLLYTPTANYNGSDSLTLTSNDLGNTGSGGSKSDSDSVTIAVNAIADTPSATSATTNEDMQTSSGLVLSRNAGDGSEVGFFQITGIIGGSLFLQDGVTPINNNDFISYAQGQAGLCFTPTSNYNSTANAPFQFTIQSSLSASAAGLGGATVVVPITVNLVNDRPLLSAGASSSFTENGAAQVVDGTVTISDVDHSQLSSATVRISGNYQSGADQLSFVNTAAIIGSWDGTSGTLTLSGVASLADYQAALRAVTYSNSSEAPSANMRTITFMGNDGVDNSLPVTATINVIAQADLPQITAGNGYALSFTEGDASPLLNPLLQVADLDDSNLEGAVIQISSGYHSAEDQLLFSNANGITGAWNSITGILTLSGSATLAHYQAALQSIRYQNNGGDQPTVGSRSVSYTVNDGDGNSAAVTSTLAVTAVNDAPTLSGSGSLTFTEGDNATVLDGSLLLADADNSTLSSAVLRFTNGFIFGEDALNFTDIHGIGGTWDSLFGVLTLQGVATIAHYQEALRSVVYANLAADNPSAAVRTLTLTVNDGSSDSVALPFLLDVLSVDDLPVLAAGKLLAYSEGDGSQVIDDGVAISDLDHGTLASALIQIGSGYVVGEDLLSYSGGLTSLWDSATATLTLSGNASLATYQSALQSITYSNLAGDSPTAGLRTVHWLVNDGISDSLLVSSTIQVSAINDRPLLSSGGNLLYTEGDGAKVLDGLVTVSDADHATLQRARLVIASGYVSGEDQLSFVNQAGISGSWDDSSGSLVLNLTGSAALADYRDLLRAIQYNNLAGENPTPGQRTVQWLVDDGTDESIVVSSTVDVVAVNDAPVAVAGNSITYSEDGVAQTLLSG
ncbi:beta strand repeat-containing protein, partial [Candidatus Magnetaquicoccus inordinatus]|uniref:beta strand repeat-containing protein n=1 Tax=Candidatus Magnetaquicoccus inordinatus TaxID=2496818 RepID=UPI001D0E1FA9